MSAPPKTKTPPPKDSDGESDEGSETSDEETEDEEQAEGGSDFESESDESTDTTKKKLTSLQPMKQQSAVKTSASGALAATPGSPSKRTRDVNGRTDKEDEPPSKKRKPEVATPAAKLIAPKISVIPLMQYSKALIQIYRKPMLMVSLSDKKQESTTKSRRATALKEKPSKGSIVEKSIKKSTKKKTQSPATKFDARPSKSNTSEGETPQKTAKPSRPWLPDEELALSKEIQKDRVHVLYGAQLPASRADPYWEKLIGRLSFMDKYDKEHRVERLCEKVRRMRLRYDSLLTRIKAGETNVWKNDHEGKLWRIWHTIWGPNKATPGMLTGDGDEEEESEEESKEEDEESDEVDEEDEIEPTEAEGRQPSAVSAYAQTNVLSRKQAQSRSDDDETNEETPVKATLPAVPAAVVKQPSASKPVPAKDTAPIATLLDTSQRDAVPDGARSAPAVATVPSVVPSDELRAENLSFLRDIRGTCVKMVEEAKTQSLLISERLLEETCAKTTQIVEDSREKCSQIMEELRMAIEGLGAITGQNGRMNCSAINYSEYPFQGGSLLLGNVLMGDQSPLEGRWREQSEAEQGLLLQRLQLVQEQARVQQEGIRLNIQKLNLQKQQQSKAQDKA